MKKEVFIHTLACTWERKGNNSRPSYESFNNLRAIQSCRDIKIELKKDLHISNGIRSSFYKINSKLFAVRLDALVTILLDSDGERSLWPWMSCCWPLSIALFPKTEK